jgi:hypothetical protein
MRATGGPRPSTRSSTPKVDPPSSHSPVHVGVRFRPAQVLSVSPCPCGSGLPKVSPCRLVHAVQACILSRMLLKFEA